MGANEPENEKLDPNVSERISRDERHLATYPVALLSFQAQRGKVISQTRETRHPITKKLIKSTWKVAGSEELGLPTPSDEAVLMVLMELSREQGFAQEVYFTQLDVLKRLNWDTSKSSYAKLQLAFERLVGVTITSQNVFWDATNKAFVQTAFHLIEEFEIIATPGRYRSKNNELPLSHFMWGAPIWRSFKDGNLKPIELSFYFALNLPLARRLFRFLDLVKWDGKPVYKIGLRKLCEEFLAMSTAKYLSVYKNSLKAAHDELIDKGFLQSVRFEANKAGDGENVIYTFATAVAALPSPEEKPVAEEKSSKSTPQTPVQVLAPANVPSLLTPERATHYKKVFDSLDTKTQNQLLEQAKATTPDFVWPHLQDPQRAVSWALWELVEKLDQKLS